MSQWGNQKIPGDKWKWKHSDSKSMWCSKSRSKREVYSDTNLPQETRKISNSLTPKGTRKKKEQNPKLVKGNKS